MVDFSFIVSLYVSDLPNVTISTSRIPPICTTAALISINQPHYRTVPHTSTVIYCTVLAPPR